MKSRRNIPNHLKVVTQEFHIFQLKSPCLELRYRLIDNEENNQQIQFPQFTMDGLYYLSLGLYQTTMQSRVMQSIRKRRLFW